MPIYEYECINKECNKFEKVVEEIQTYRGPGPVCQDCQEELKRLISLSNFNLVGNGWSRDGFATKDQKKHMQKEGKLREYINKY